MTSRVPRPRIPEELGQSAAPNAVSPELLGPDGQPLRAPMDHSVEVQNDIAERQALKLQLAGSRQQLVEELKQREPHGWKHGPILDFLLTAAKRGTAWQDRFPQPAQTAYDRFVDDLTELVSFELDAAEYVHHNPEHSDGRHGGATESNHDRNDIALKHANDELGEILELPRRGRSIGEFAAYLGAGGAGGFVVAEGLSATHTGLFFGGLATIGAAAGVAGAASSMRLSREKYTNTVPASELPRQQRRGLLYRRQEPGVQREQDYVRKGALDYIEDRAKHLLVAVGFSDDDELDSAALQESSEQWLQRRVQNQPRREDRVIGREERALRQAVEGITERAVASGNINEQRARAAWELMLHELRSYQNSAYETQRKSRRNKAVGALVAVASLTLTYNGVHAMAEHDKQPKPTKPNQPNQINPGSDFNNTPAQTIN